MNFLAHCILGTADFGEIDDFICIWHEEKLPNELHEFLGLTDDQYFEISVSVDGEERLNRIIDDHKYCIYCMNIASKYDYIMESNWWWEACFEANKQSYAFKPLYQTTLSDYEGVVQSFTVSRGFL